MRVTLTGLAIVLLLGACSPFAVEPRGSTTGFRATLTGAAETPPNAGGSGGYLKAQYIHASHILKWELYVNGLSSPMTHGYFHGPDGVGGEAGIVEFNQPFSGNALIGGATLTEQQAADLLAGRWYVDIQTEQFPGGEIRGPVVRDTRLLRIP
jgi:hypothetical protein